MPEFTDYPQETTAPDAQQLRDLIEAQLLAQRIDGGIKSKTHQVDRFNEKISLRKINP